MSPPKCGREIGAFAITTGLGVLWDEHLRLGLTSFIYMCRATNPGLIQLLAGFVELLPVATLATLIVSASLLLASTRANQRDRHRALTAHTSCLFAMPAGLWLCSKASASIDTTPKAVVAMLLVDTALMFAAAWILAKSAPRAGVEPATPRLGGECSIH
jgi:hypothetical protein